mmetsp:Transcript_7912/g.17455  ORF Transcript_7912/g.17455 Transcript_7912/m.17455 type:complete len:214 (+) Transcript_7912:328-969(+)|eukprot:6205868-Pleurochrysis_carterae.AAC.1
MSRSLRVSNGELPLYGRQTQTEQAAQQQWRHRICNEKVGAPQRDFSGANTAVSLLWSASPEGQVDHSSLASHKRQSERKHVQDFGVHLSPSSSLQRGTGQYTPSLPPPRTAEATANRSQTASVAGSVAGSMASGGRRSTNFASAATRTAQMPAEQSVLVEAAHARELGQTFLRLGNLQEARKHFRHAEKLLQLDASRADGLNEFDSIRKDTFS